MLPTHSLYERVMDSRSLLPISVVAGLCSLAVLGCGSRTNERVDWPADPLPLFLTSISLERTGCLGVCPIYSISFNRNGSAVYSGKSNVRLVGVSQSHITSSAFDSLAAFVLRHEVLGLEEMPNNSVMDMPSSSIEITYDGRTKMIFRQQGPNIERSPAFERVAGAIDSVAENVFRLNLR